MALGSGVNALAVVRSLGRRGIPVFMAEGGGDPRPWCGRYARPLPLPSPEEAPQAVTRRLTELARTVEAGPGGARLVVYPCGDEWLLYLADARAELWAAGVRFALPEGDLLRQLLDKEATYRLAEAHGCPHPEGFGLLPPPGPSLDRLAEGLPYPVLLKPRDSRAFSREAGVKAVRCDDAAQLRQAAERYGHLGELLVQRYIPGGDPELLTVGVYRSLAGEVAGVFTGHKVRQHPEGAGVCSLGESLPPEAMGGAVGHALALLERLGLVGIAQVEFKRHPATHEVYLMEVNPRTWSWHGLTGYCGVDLTWLAYRDLAGLGLEARPRQGRSGWWWFAALDLRTSLPRLRAGRLGWGPWLRSLPPWRGGGGMFALFAWDDPLPAWHYLWRQLSAWANSA